MATITFASHGARLFFNRLALSVLHNAAEDDRDSEHVEIWKLLAITNPLAGGTDRLAFEVPDDLVFDAMNLWDCVVDNGQGDAGDFDVVFARGKWDGNMTVRAALMHAVIHLSNAPHGSRLMGARTVLLDILDQRGCEHFNKAGNGSLTDLMQIIIRG